MTRIMSSTEQDKWLARMARRRRERKIRLTGRVLFVCYLCFLVYFLFFADWYNHRPGIMAEVAVNLEPLREIRRFLRYREQLGFKAVFLNLAGNILGFIPFGFFLPVISRRFHNGLVVVLLAALSSSVVEAVQLITRTGTCDVDDVILNTAGALAGYIIFLICNAIRRRFYGR